MNLHVGIKIVVPIKNNVIPIWWKLCQGERFSLSFNDKFWIGTTLNHIDTKVILPKYQGSWMLPGMVYRPE